MAKRIKTSLRFRIFLSSLVVLPFLFTAAMLAVYLLSSHQFRQEQTQQLEFVGQRVMNNIVAMFEQAEKIAVILSKNPNLLSQLSVESHTVEEQLRKTEYIESSLRSLILSYPYIETIYISLDNGETYLYSFAGGLSSSQIRTLNAFLLPMYEGGELPEEGVWYAPNSSAVSLEAGNGNPTYERIIGGHFVYMSRMRTDMMVTLTIDPHTIETMLNQDHSVYSYEIHNLSLPLTDNRADAVLTNQRLGLSLHIHVDHPKLEEQLANITKILAVLLAGLFLAVTVSAMWFARKVVAPFEWLKRQLSDIEKSQVMDDVIHYKIRRKVPVSLRAKIFVYMMIAGGTGLSIILAVNFYSWTALIKEQVSDYIFEYLYQSQNSIQFNMKNSEKYSTSLLMDGRLQELLEEEHDHAVLAAELKKLFSYYHIISKNIKYLNIYDSNGNFVYSTIHSLLNEQPIQERNIYPVLARSQGEMVYFNELQDPFGDHVLAMAKKIMSTDTPGKLLGYLLIAVNERELDLLDDNMGIPSLNFLVVDEAGGVLYSRKEEPSAAQISELLSTTTYDNGMQHINMNGRDLLLLFGQLGNTGWRVFSTIETEDVYRGQKEITLLYSSLFMIMMAVILGVIYLIAQSVSEPVTKLVHGIRGIIREEFRGSFFKRITGPDEISELSDHIYAMIVKIQRLMKDIIAYEVKTREIQLEFQKAELSNLIRQINPHFLYNTLETIKWMTMDLTGSENKASLMLHELAHFLRYGVHSDVRTTTLEEELSHARAYLNIQKMRYGDKLRVKWDVPKETGHVGIMKFILQPIVENALIHGIDAGNKQGVLMIQSRFHLDKLVLTVTDNGIGMDPERIREIMDDSAPRGRDKHVGLRNIRQRLFLIYGDNARMVIRSKKNHWTQVRIEMPIEFD
jgi:sensor histidine kinase YesM